MRKSSYLIGLALLIGALCSCAHKSGHIRRPQTSNQKVFSDNGPVVSKPKRTNNKLEGSQIFTRFHSAVFMVYTTDGSNVYQGSGFFIDDNGLAISNYHVFKDTGVGMEAIKLERDDTAYKVSEIYTKSEEYDFILFRVECGRTNYIPIASSKPSIGDRIFTIGSPKGLENTFSSGDVSQWRDEFLLQISAAIDHGSSGGALINEYGEVVGITSGTLDANSQANLNYAWSIEAVKPYLVYK